MCESKPPFPTVESQLRHNILKIPPEVYSASGIVINGRRIKSFVFTTDLAIIRNCDADAVFAVYPFTPQQAISDAISKRPISRCFAAWAEERPRVSARSHWPRTWNVREPWAWC